MKKIENIRDLEKFGIDPLTGESDAHMYRILCDVTQRGKRIIERTMGVEITFAENWNGGHKEDPHIGSCLLPYEFVPSIGVFCLLTDPDISEVWLMKNGTVLGFGVEDVDLKDRLRKFHEGELRQIFYTRPSDRNVHQMTGEDGMIYRLACLHCDREDFDGVAHLPTDWDDIGRVQSYPQAMKTYDDPSKEPKGFSVLDWFTHLGMCPNCQ